HRRGTRERRRTEKAFADTVQNRPGGTLQSAAETAAIEALKRLGLRDYALDPIARAELAALTLAAHQSKINLVRVIETLANTTATVVAPGGKKTVIRTGLRQHY